MKDELKLKQDVETFFAAAFCADRAVVERKPKEFEVECVVKIVTSDARGTFYIATVRPSLHKGNK